MPKVGGVIFTFRLVLGSSKVSDSGWIRSSWIAFHWSFKVSKAVKIRHREGFIRRTRSLLYFINYDGLEISMSLKGHI